MKPQQYKEFKKIITNLIFRGLALSGTAPATAAGQLRAGLAGSELLTNRKISLKQWGHAIGPKNFKLFYWLIQFSVFGRGGPGG